MVGSVLLLSNLLSGASNDTWLDGLRESTSPCVGTNGDPGIGFCASRSANLGCSPIGLCFTDTAEQWEPDDARESRPVLRERGVKFPRATRLVVSIRGKKHWLWRVVGQDGFVLEVLAQSRRNVRRTNTQYWPSAT